MASRKRKRGSGKGRGFRGLRLDLSFLRSRPLVGVVLVVAGLFLSAAFVSGGGAFVGEAGRVGATHLMGVVGLLSFGPLLVLGGALVLLGGLEGKKAAGAGVLVVAFCITLALRLPDGRLFEPGAYREAGGILGSAIYAVVGGVAGIIGVVLLLGLLYVLGAYLLLEPYRDRLAARIKGLPPSVRRGRGSSSAQRGGPTKTEGQKKEPEKKAKKEEPAAEKEELEVVLPESGEETPRFEALEKDFGEYSPPSPELLKRGEAHPEHDAREVGRLLTEALAQLGVEARVARAVVGPRVTRYELRLGKGVKVGKVRNLQQDIAYALAATEVRILAPIPGRSAVGVEVPNTKAATVTLGDVFAEYPSGNEWALPVGMGKDISGRALFMDLSEMPHLLVAGATGSGKSVMVNSLLTSLLLTSDPRRVRMILIDPKRVELSQFTRVPHLLTPVVTDVKKASNALSWAVSEMERRYEVLEEKGVRSLEGYNAASDTPMPYIVVVIDELADLMMASASKVEDAIIRLAQKARAVGIHLVVATQRPSADVITGMIKANIPSRVAFAVSSQVDSRVILDTSGAEALLGSGDMLYKPVTASRPARVQGAFITEGEVDSVVSACFGEVRVEYVEEVTEGSAEVQEEAEPDDDLLPEAASFVISSRQASVSAVQRRFRVGYSRAGRIIDALERKGVVGPYEGSKPRSIVASEEDVAYLFGSEGETG